MPYADKQKRIEAAIQWRIDNLDKARESRRKSTAKWRLDKKSKSIEKVWRESEAGIKSRKQSLEKARQNPEYKRKRTEYMREYRMYKLQCRAKRNEYLRDRTLKKLGETISYREKLESQNSVCAICGKTNDDGTALHIDHDHTTGQVRRLLCRPCNLTLGQVNDDPQLLIKMATYLLEHKLNN